jgi:hypothetical protein
LGSQFNLWGLTDLDLALMFMLILQCVFGPLSLINDHAQLRARLPVSFKSAETHFGRTFGSVKRQEAHSDSLGRENK